LKPLFLKIIALYICVSLGIQAGAQQLSDLNRTAMLIGGMLPSSEYKLHTDIYKQHKKTTDEAWSNANKKHYTPIRTWLFNNEIPTSSDTTALFYPFSGPDFLFANMFFSKASKYVLVGLESPGSEPKLHSLSKDSLSRYFKAVQFSLRYINKAGYFVTSQMIEDLDTRSLDGVSHILLYYLSRQGYIVNSMETLQLQANGKLTAPVNKQNALRIKFIHPTESKERELIYIDTDLSDYGLSFQPGLLHLLSERYRWNVYVKSGSYLLHSNEFSRLRDTILVHFKYLLQDDSGIPIKFLPQPTYVFGSYTQTTKSFDYAYQADLATSMKMNNYFNLPFQIGYNIWVDETVITLTSRHEISNLAKTQYKPEKVVLSAENKEEKTVEKVFKIQLLSTSTKQDVAKLQQKFGTPVEEYEHEGKYKYTCGRFSTVHDAIKLRDELKAKGFPDIFIVTFRNNMRME